MKEQEPRRASDGNLVNKVTDNVWFRFLHQALTLMAPVLGGYFLWIYQTNTAKLDNIQVLLTTKVAAYDEHFINLDQRVNRLEIRADYPHGRMAP